MAELNPSKWTKQYGWMDPDFTETLFPTLPWVDSRTEFSFWCLWSAPILIATEINHMVCLVVVSLCAPVSHEMD